MKPALRDQLDRHLQRLSDLDTLLAAPDAAQDMARYRQLTREHVELSSLAGRYRRLRQREDDLLQAQTLLAQKGLDEDLQEMAREEQAQAQEDIGRLAAELERALLPKDPDDDRDVYLEVRAGTGGEESALFAGELLRTYLRYAERQGWHTEMVSHNESDLGGTKEAVVHIRGDGPPGVYARLKFESGGHRVQRVPSTESQGRIHTSACTVAVLPEPDPQQAVEIDPADLRIDTFRASGAGGQHVNRTESAIRITHLPTGLVAECQDDRSQHRNKAKALAVLATRLNDRARQEREQREAAERRSLVGSGDRSDRIRTYNFPQGRVTDHRINLTLYQLDAVMQGDLDPLVLALTRAHEAELLEQQAREDLR